MHLVSLQNHKETTKEVSIQSNNETFLCTLKTFLCSLYLHEYERVRNILNPDKHTQGIIFENNTKKNNLQHQACRIISV